MGRQISNQWFQATCVASALRVCAGIAPSGAKKLQGPGTSIDAGAYIANAPPESYGGLLGQRRCAAFRADSHLAQN
jgi:hypothetical protein